MTAIFIFGLLDDRYEFPSRPQYRRPVPLALLAIAFIILIQKVNNPFTNEQIVFPWPVVGLLTIFWFMGMMNTVNWLDGLDGLAAGVSASSPRSLHPHAARGPVQRRAAAAGAGRRDAGLPALQLQPGEGLHGQQRIVFPGLGAGRAGDHRRGEGGDGAAGDGPADPGRGLADLQPVGATGHPAFNGRDHLHHRLLDIGFTQRQIVLGYYAFCALFGVLALLLENRVYKLIALAVLGAAALAVLAWAARQPAGKYVNGKRETRAEPRRETERPGLYRTATCSLTFSSNPSASRTMYSGRPFTSS